MDEKTERFLSKYKENTALLGENLAASRIGETVLDLIAADIDPTIENICSSLREKISITKSVQGSIEESFDRGRSPLEYALFCIENKVQPHKKIK